MWQISLIKSVSIILKIPMIINNKFNNFVVYPHFGKCE